MTMRGTRRQRGAVAVEFAFVFPLLFLLMYGIVVYSYVFVLNSALNFAAQESAEAAVRVDPSAANADALRTTQARQTAASVLNWLPVHQRDRVVGTGGSAVQVQFCPESANASCPPDGGGIVVTLTMPIADPPLFPRITLPLIGNVPPLPQSLRAQAVARL